MRASEPDDAIIERILAGDRSIRPNLYERREILRRLYDQGLNDQQIHRLTGISWQTVWRWRQRTDRPPLAYGSNKHKRTQEES